MKHILTKIEFHYTYLVVALGFVLTGYFSNLIIFTSIILIHELGHTLMIIKYKLKLKKIIIYPYGGLVKYEGLLNLDINKELLIAFSGIIIQIIYYLIIFFLFKLDLIRLYIFNLFRSYHYAILIFNLLPIYPLDGSNILNLILNKYFHYKLSIKLTIIISIITIFISIKYYLSNYSYILILFILFDNIIKYYQYSDYLYYRFLLERYLHNFNFKKLKIIKNKNKMYKNCRHLIKSQDKYVTEKEYLKKIFDIKSKL